MPYPQHFIRCRLRATYTHDRETGEIGLKLGRADGGDPLPIVMPSREAVRLLLYWLDDLTASGLPEDLQRIALMTDAIAAIVDRKPPPATPSEDSEIDAVVSALAALTDRVRALEERAESQAYAPLDFGHDGTMYVSPAVINKVRAAEKSVAAASVVNEHKADIAEGPDWTATHDFASGETRFQSCPADKIDTVVSIAPDGTVSFDTKRYADMLARLVELEAAASTLQASVDTMQDDVSSIRGTIEAMGRPRP